MTIEPTPKLLNILYTLANGRLPWGVEWEQHIPLCDEASADPEYILCCEHTLKYPDESAAVVGAGLMLPGVYDDHGRPTLGITKAGRAFLDKHQHLVEFDG